MYQCTELTVSDWPSEVMESIRKYYQSKWHGESLNECGNSAGTSSVVSGGFFMIYFIGSEQLLVPGIVSKDAVWNGVSWQYWARENCVVSPTFSVDEVNDCKSVWLDRTSVCFLLAYKGTALLRLYISVYSCTRFARICHKLRLLRSSILSVEPRASSNCPSGFTSQCSRFVELFIFICPCERSKLSINLLIMCNTTGKVAFTRVVS